MNYFHIILYFKNLIGPQVHENIGFSIKDVEFHRDQCQVPLSIVTLFI